MYIRILHSNELENSACNNSDEYHEWIVEIKKLDIMGKYGVYLYKMVINGWNEPMVVGIRMGHTFTACKVTMMGEGF